MLLGLLAVAMVSVVLTSCEQEALEDIGVETPIENIEQSALEVDVPEFFVPHGYDTKMSDEEMDSYLNSLNLEDFEKLALHRKVVYYFASLDKQELLENNASYGDIFNENTITELLSERDALAFQTFDVETFSMSRCTGWQYTGIVDRFVRYNWPAYCHDYYKDKRICTNWWTGNGYVDYRYRFKCHCC